MYNYQNVCTFSSTSKILVRTLTRNTTYFGKCLPTKNFFLPKCCVHVIGLGMTASWMTSAMGEGTYFSERAPSLFPKLTVDHDFNAKRNSGTVWQTYCLLQPKYSVTLFYLSYITVDHVLAIMISSLNGRSHTLLWWVTLRIASTLTLRCSPKC